ncbi:hypothetical protein HH214_03370 [Mucilaginibacter robiniae]|uniref:Uncharacterized protein n=1 Tax=Mucilaginibacter robiniae TaxID=2728022 RepID=A0A7L5DXP6_9SPHI|nr:hypothetical protein [Mucilaginibacter robiniae]QJD94988.1 hypothetical protein HH214_03370 [Mucilaginibacter robiniae]
MKTILSYVLLMSLLVCSSITFAQKVKRHCELYYQYHLHFARIGPDGNIHIDAGVSDTTPIFQDSTVVKQLKKAETFKTLSAALDYLSELGWNQESIVPVHGSKEQEVRILLSKSFDQSEIVSLLH